MFLLRWSARDLRRRWLQVTAIALIIAVGTGVYSALGSTATWRRVSNDASFEALAMYDVRIKAAEGVDAPQGGMVTALDRLVDRTIVAEAEERLIVATQVDASTDGKAIMVPGRIVGVSVQGGPKINRLSVQEGEGRNLDAQDDAASTVVLERNFASYYSLPASGTIRVGGRTVQYVGQALAPEYFLVVTDEGGFFAQANFAAVFTSLDTAQQMSGRPGRVNDLLVRVRPASTCTPLPPRSARRFAGTGLAVTVMERRDENAYRLLYDDIEGDQQFWNVFAALILAGAAFGAFNLSSRMVEAQRREIGIGMALGIPRRDLVLRPMLVGVEIAVLGVVFGSAWDSRSTPPFGGLHRHVAAAHLADRLPTRSVRARRGARLRVAGRRDRVARLASRAGAPRRCHRHDAPIVTRRLSPLLRRLRWPRGTYARMPLGNVLRTPRRTLLTAFGIAAAVTALVSTLGMIDSFVDTLDRNDREVLQDHPDRLAVALQGFHDVQSPEVTAIRSLPSIGAIQPVLRFGGRLAAGAGEPIDVFVDVIDLNGGVWRRRSRRALFPRIVPASSSPRKRPRTSASRLEHRHARTSGATWDRARVVRTEVHVAAVHPSPFRFSVYLDRSQLSAFGIPDVVNELYVIPASGSTPQDVQRALFGVPGRRIRATCQHVDQGRQGQPRRVRRRLQVLEFFMLLLALLIAYNATSINTDERRREHATLFAFSSPGATVSADGHHRRPAHRGCSVRRSVSQAARSCCDGSPPPSSVARCPRSVSTRPCPRPPCSPRSCSASRPSRSRPSSRCAVFAEWTFPARCVSWNDGRLLDGRQVPRLKMPSMSCRL